METRERFLACVCPYEIVLGEGEWYEIWRNGVLVGERKPGPFDSETNQPMVMNKLIRIKTEMCLEEELRRTEGGG
jgi:hypothetical protein